MVNNEHKLGIIGFGGMAQFHADTLISNNYERVKVKGVYDLDPDKRKDAERFGILFYDSNDDLLNDKEIDMVLIATTNEVHKELSIEALKRGKNVLCEKPATINSEELKEIIKTARETHRVFTINQNRRVNKDFVLMKRQVEAGLIGEPYVIESRVEGSRGMPKGWRTVKSLGGGMMLDWGVHLIDQIMYMISERVTSVFCQMFSLDYPEVDDNFRLDITFESGLLAHIEVSTNNYITHPRWYVLGKNGTLVIDDWNCKGKIISCVDREDKWEEQIFYTKAGPTKTMAPRSSESVKTIELSEPMDVEDSLIPTYEQFCNAVEGKSELTIKPEEALRVIRVIEAAFVSAKKNEVVKTNI